MSASHTITLMSLEVTTLSEASQTLLAYKTCFRGTCYSRTARGCPLISYSTLMSLEVARSSKTVMAMLTGEAEFTWL
jgi:hypothetical protein